MIFGSDGFVRIKDGYNYDYLTDTQTCFGKGQNKSLALSATGDFLTVKGSTNMPGILAAGRASMNGGLITTFGKASSVVRNSAGNYTINHTIGHANYIVNVTPRSAAGWYKVHPVILGQTTSSVNVCIVDSGTSNGFTDYDFDFTITGVN